MGPTAMAGSPSRSERARISRSTSSSGAKTSPAQRPSAGSPCPNPFTGGEPMPSPLLRRPVELLAPGAEHGDHAVVAQRGRQRAGERERLVEDRGERGLVALALEHLRGELVDLQFARPV